jgi:hypothetical protein
VAYGFFGTLGTKRTCQVFDEPAVAVFAAYICVGTIQKQLTPWKHAFATTQKRTHIKLQVF